LFIPVRECIVTRDKLVIMVSSTVYGIEELPGYDFQDGLIEPGVNLFLRALQKLGVMKL
jgi:hypothetical protein